ncbi:MAG TPA: HDOD domain-containing protein [Terracidiphilus sp.]|nr:HDOD domain-containing protein [Terracidiphilus sp.]
MTSELVRYIARQPILDRSGNVYAYELLFRNGLTNSFQGDLETATYTTVDNAVMFGLEYLTAGCSAFVNCTGNVVIDELPRVLPPARTVLELLETVEPTPELVEACRKLKKLGFRIALDDFIWDPKLAPLVELADYIKIDMLQLDHEQRVKLLKDLPRNAATLLAEKVETQEQYQQARDEGFRLFQGYFFCYPEMMVKRGIPANTRFHLQILQELLKDPLDLQRLGPLVESDASLAYRLLRLVNSVGFGIRREVQSIHSALVIVGDDSFRRIATLAIASQLNSSRSAEILHTALVRARFCETAAPSCQLNSTEQYLLGMLSLFPAMLQVPIDEIAPMLPLRQEIRDSLSGLAQPERKILTWLEAHERGNWSASDQILQSQGLDSEQLTRFYVEAVQWADTTMRAAA